MALSQEEIKQVREKYKIGSNLSSQKPTGVTSADERIAGIEANLSKPEDQPEEEGVAGFQGVGTGIGKGLVSTFRGGSGLGEKIVKGVGRFFTPKSLEKKLGFEKTETTGAEEVIPEELITPKGTAEKIGFFGEQIAEFFIPSGAITKAGKVAEAAVKGGKLAKGTAKLAAVSGAEAVTGATQAAIQSGEFGKEARETAIAGAVVPGAFKAVGAIVKPTFKAIGKGVAGLSGKLTGVQGDVIVEAFKNPKVIQATRQAGKNIEQAQETLLDDVKTGLNKLKELRAKSYKPALDKIKLSKENVSNIVDEARIITKEAFDTSGIRVADDLSLDFSQSSIVNGQNVIERAWKDIVEWSDNTPGGIDTLKRRLYAFGEQLPLDAKPAKNIVDGMAGGVRSGLIDNVPGYKEMVGDYEKMSSLIDEINVAFSLGGKNKETAIKRIMAALRENNQTRKDLLDLVGGKTGQDIVADVSGVQLAPATSRGLAGIISPGVGGLAAIINPAALPEILTFLALTSPRLTAELVNVMGRVTDQMIKANKFSPEIQRAIREIIIKAKE